MTNPSRHDTFWPLSNLPAGNTLIEKYGMPNPAPGCPLGYIGTILMLVPHRGTIFNDSDIRGQEHRIDMATTLREEGS